MSFSAVGTLGILLALILIHEFGHFIVARLFSIKVDRFAIGIGPTVYAFTRGGTLYSFGMLPLGGYVQFREKEEEIESMRALGSESKVAQMCVFAAGCGMNLLTAAALFTPMYYFGGTVITPLQVVQVPGKPFWEALLSAVSYTGALFSGLSVGTVVALYEVVIGNASAASGPIGIIHAAFGAVQNGWTTTLWFMGLLSVGLAAFNLIPIPPLDGWHLLRVGLEAATGKVVPALALKVAGAAGIVFLLTIIAVVTFSDIRRLLV